MGIKCYQMEKEGKDGWWIKRKQPNMQVPGELSARVQENPYVVGDMANTVALNYLNDKKGSHGAISGAMVKLRLRDHQKRSSPPEPNSSKNNPYPPPRKFPALPDEFPEEPCFDSESEETAVKVSVEDEVDGAVISVDFNDAEFFDAPGESSRHPVVISSTKSQIFKEYVPVEASAPHGPSTHSPKEWRNLTANKRFGRSVPHINQHSPAPASKVHDIARNGRIERKSETFTEKGKHQKDSPDRELAPQPRPRLNRISSDSSSLSEVNVHDSFAFGPESNLTTSVATRKHSPLRTSRSMLTTRTTSKTRAAVVPDDYMEFASDRRGRFIPKRMFKCLRIRSKTFHNN